MSKIKNLLSYLTNIHFQSLLGNGVMAVAGIVTIGILYRALSVKEIGVYVFFFTIWGLVDTVRAGFLTSAFIKFHSGAEPVKADKIAGSAWILALLLTCGLITLNFVVSFISSYYSISELQIFHEYFPMITLATLPSFMANLVVQSEKRFDKLLYMRLFNQLLFTGSVIVLISLNKTSLELILLLFAVTNAVTGLLAIALGWTKLLTIINFAPVYLKELFHFGKYSMGTSVGANLFRVSDTVFINFFLGPTALAIYNVGGRLVQVVEIPILSLAASGMPILSDHFNNDRKGEMMLLMKKLIGILVILLGCGAIVSIIFADPLVNLIAGPKYVDTAAPSIFRIFMVITILYPIDRFFAIAVDVIHLPKINFYKILLMLIINLICNYISIVVFESLYLMALTGALPILAAILITYRPLNQYAQFNFWSIFVIGYRECILRVKGLKRQLFTEKNTYE